MVSLCNQSRWFVRGHDQSFGLSQLSQDGLEFCGLLYVLTFFSDGYAISQDGEFLTLAILVFKIFSDDLFRDSCWEFDSFTNVAGFVDCDIDECV